MAREPVGLGRYTVRLEPHSEGWAKLFEAERLRLKPALGDDVTVKHIGSTSIPGLKANLREDLKVAAKYQTLKEQLAEQFPGDHEAYTDGKHAFIQDISSRAE